MRIFQRILTAWCFAVVLVTAHGSGRIVYRGDSYTDGVTKFTRGSSVCISAAPDSSAVHADVFAQVVRMAQRQGLKSVPKAEADFELVVNIESKPVERAPGAFSWLCIDGLVFPLSGNGETRSDFSVWEGVAHGRLEGWRRAHSAELEVDVAKVVEKFVALVGRGAVYTPQSMAGEIGGSTPGSGPKMSAEGLPTEYVTTAPRTEDFNRLARQFFDNDPIDFGKQSIAPSALRSLQGQTANELYRKLKSREKDFHGAVTVLPRRPSAKAIIVVFSIVQQKGARKTLYERYLHINISKGNMLLGADRGMYSKCEVE